MYTRPMENLADISELQIPQKLAKRSVNSIFHLFINAVSMRERQYISPIETG